MYHNKNGGNIFFGGCGKPGTPSSRAIVLPASALTALGVTAIATQIVLLREFLSVFYGNELVIGIVLANWMILTGLGSFLGKFSERLAPRAPATALALIGLALLPAITVALLRFLRNIVFIPGSMIGIVQAFTSSLVLLAPFCLLSGFAFALFAAALSSRRGENLVADSYSWESLGSALGGAAFSLLLLPWLETFQALTVLLALDLGLAFLVAWESRRRLLSALCAALFLTGALAMGYFEPDALTRRFLFPGQELLFFKDTPYGNLTVTRQGDQVNFFENTMLMSSTGEVTADEENVHYAMVQHPRPRHVLLIGGGISGAAREIMKYQVASLDYAEVNPWIIDLALTFTPELAAPQVRVINDDARRYVRRTTDWMEEVSRAPGMAQERPTDRMEEVSRAPGMARERPASRYDVALINLPDPETAHLNRYYTVEFFRELKGVLADGAIISISLLPAAEYQGPEAKLLTSSLFGTLKEVFANVLIVPGNRNYFLASDGPLDIRIGRLMEERGIETAYVNHYYLDDRMLEERGTAITAALDGAAPINTDFAPVCYFQQLAYWLSSLGTSTAPWILISLVALAMVMWKGSVIGVGIFTAGFCASSFEMILLIAFQSLYGSLYRMTGMVITAYMAGLAVGSWRIRRFAPGARIDYFIALQLLVAIVGLVLPLALFRLQGAELPPLMVHLIFVTMAFVVAALIGMEFSVASLIRTGPAAAVAGELYGLDLAGSAVGALVVTVYALPLLGMQNVSMLTGLVSAAGAGICFFRRGRY